MKDIKLCVDLEKEQLLDLINLQDVCVKGLANRESLRAVLDALARLVPYQEAVVFIGGNIADDICAERIVGLRHDTDWLECYLEHNLIDQDPRYAYFQRHREARSIEWSKAYQNAEPGVGESFHAHAKTYGRTNGLWAISRPLDAKHNTLLSLSIDADLIAEAQLYIAENTVLHLHEMLSREGNLNRLALEKEDQPKLADRDIEILQWCQAGKTSWEISQILRCSEATVKYRLTHIFHKLGVANRTHAVAKALEYKLISVA